MNITIIGAGYVGLVSGLCLFKKCGHHVTFIDKNPDIIDQLKQGRIHIFEPGLEDILHEYLEKKDGGSFSLQIEKDQIDESHATFLCVDTPMSPEGKADLRALLYAAADLGKALANRTKAHLTIVKSTVPPTTTCEIVTPVLLKESGLSEDELLVATNPEFLREGTSVDDFMNPDRLVFGFDNQKASEILEGIYANFDVQRHIMSTNSAETVKYANNYLLSLLISVSNEIAGLCERVDGVDVLDVIECLTRDRRWRTSESSEAVPPITSYLHPGCGFGGSCLPKDTKALAYLASTKNVSMPILNGVIDINEAQPYQSMNLLKELLGDLKGKKIALLGLAFKPDSDDIRHSPTLKMIDFLKGEGASIHVHDPLANLPSNLVSEKSVQFTRNLKEALKGAEAAVVITSWKEYRNLSSDDFISQMKIPNVFDTRRILSKNNLPGVNYYGTGIK